MNIGDSVGPYTIEGKLAQGGMGVVWTARDASGEIVVLKSIRVRDADPDVAEDLRERLRREAEILRKLHHEHVVPFVEAFEERGEVFLVMEYIEGHSLEQRLGESGPLPLEDHLKVLSQVASALEHAHGLGVTHRDLKPANVMVAAGPRARVLDFGLARALDSTRLTATGLVMGTVAFMAPEQARGETVDSRADIFSLGMMLARALGVRKPFRAAAMSEIYMRLVSPEPVVLDEWLPKDVAQGLASMVEKDPEDRTATAVDALSFLDVLVREGPLLVERLEAARTAPLTERASSPRLPSLARPILQSALTSLSGRTAAGRGGTLVLLGHPGGGKSHALRTAREHLEVVTQGVESYSFASGALAHLIPLQHLTRCNQLATRSLALDEIDPGESATALLPDDATDLSLLVPQFLEAVIEGASLGPCALLLDDVHHANAGELAWIARLLELTRDLPLLVVLAGDVAPEGAGAEGSQVYGEFLASTSTTPDVVRLTLDHFDAEAIRLALVEERVPADVASLVGTLSAGNAGVANHLLREWYRGMELNTLALTAPVKLVAQLRSRWELVDPGARTLIRTLVESGGGMRVEDLQLNSGLTRLVLRSRLRDLERKHGWVTVADGFVRLTQPFLGTVVSKHAD